MHKKNDRKGHVVVKEEELEYSEGASESEKSGSKAFFTQKQAKAGRTTVSQSSPANSSNSSRKSQISRSISMKLSTSSKCRSAGSMTLPTC